MPSSYPKQYTLPFDKRTFHHQVFQLTRPTFSRFKKVIFGYLSFHVGFFLLLLGELVAFVAAYAFFSATNTLALMLALFFFTLFLYMMLRLYLEAKKSDLFADIVDEFLDRCKELIRYQEGIPEHHIALANGASKFALELKDQEYTLYAPPRFLQGSAPLLERLSAFLHWKDFHDLKELLLEANIEEHLKVVKCEPTNLEVHAALANAYVMLSSLYAEPSKGEGFDEERWVPEEKKRGEMEKQFRATAKRAIEEFKILNTYAPDDPWVHRQLAYSYHDLRMPQEEIREYEIILRLCPDDKDTLFKLGMLYFQQGLNAQGLRIYELLKKQNYEKAEKLIKFYGSFEEEGGSSLLI